MTHRILTQLQNRNDNSTHTNHAETGGITFDVLPTGSGLPLHFKIRVLEQMPQRRNPTHPHFITMLSSPSVRPRNLPHQPHTMKTFDSDKASAEAQAAEERRRHESRLEKEAMRSVLMSGNITTLKKVVNVPKETARAEAQAAEERRRHESMLEKEAMRSVLMSRHKPQEGATKTAILPPRNLFGLLNQDTPRGPKKLAAFRKACTQMQVPFSPDNYENGKAKSCFFHVRIFDPAGSSVWYVTDWDGQDICFGLVDGIKMEWGTFSLRNLSMHRGPFGIGLEVDVSFSPVPYSAVIDKEAEQ